MLKKIYKTDKEYEKYVNKFIWKGYMHDKVAKTFDKDMTIKQIELMKENTK